MDLICILFYNSLFRLGNMSFKRKIYMSPPPTPSPKKGKELLFSYMCKCGDKQKGMNNNMYYHIFIQISESNVQKVVGYNFCFWFFQYVGVQSAFCLFLSTSHMACFPCFSCILGFRPVFLFFSVFLIFCLHSLYFDLFPCQFFCIIP